MQHPSCSSEAVRSKIPQASSSLRLSPLSPTHTPVTDIEGRTGSPKPDEPRPEPRTAKHCEAQRPAV